MAASRSSKPRDVRPIESFAERSATRRLTLFETAGCATGCRCHRLHLRRSASRSSKPRDVRPPGAGTHTYYFHRLTLFETAGCATGGRCSPRWRIRPPHALRNRGMCDGQSGRHPHQRRCRLTLFETAGCATQRAAGTAKGCGPPHALRNRGMCDRRDQVAARAFSPASRSSKPRDVRRSIRSIGASRRRRPPHALRNRGMCDGESG